MNRDALLCFGAGIVVGWWLCRQCYRLQHRRLRKEVELLRQKSEALKKTVNENQ